MRRTRDNVDAPKAGMASGLSGGTGEVELQAISRVVDLQAGCELEAA